MSRVFVCGLGAVSPAGWGVPVLREALKAREPLPITELARPGWIRPLRVRMVPPPAARPAFLAHPRLRRVSPITQYAAGAALEAIGKTGAPPMERLGLITCLHSGCIQYSYRFFQETLDDPATASPLIFPETVFAAPGSHIAALLQNVPVAATLVGDPATFLQGVALAADWLEERRVDACLVLGAEETNWLLADALWHFDRRAILSGGAGAILLRANPQCSLGVELERITSVQTFSPQTPRSRAAQLIRRELPASQARDLLCDGLQGRRKADADEESAWKDWTGSRLSPKMILGEGMMAGAALQCVATCDAVATKAYPAANLSLVGCNQHAIGARFVF